MYKVKLSEPFKSMHTSSFAKKKKNVLKSSKQVKNKNTIAFLVLIEQVFLSLQVVWTTLLLKMWNHVYEIKVYDNGYLQRLNESHEDI